MAAVPTMVNHDDLVRAPAVRDLGLMLSSRFELTAGLHSALKCRQQS